MNVEDIKEKVIKNATDLMLRDGCRRVTMDYIATEMHISKRTLYEIFATKEELLIACVSQLQKSMETTKDQLFSQEAEPILLALTMLNTRAVHNIKFDKFMRDLKHYYPEIMDSFIAKHTDSFCRSLTESLQIAREKGLLRPNVDLDMVVDAINSYLQNRNASQLSKIQCSVEMGYTFLRGLLNTEAIARYDSLEEHYKEILRKKYEETDTN